jgi:hypothetical protein
MEDCRIGKELKQSTCRYVKECKRGWTRNEKFVCRKTNRRLVDPNEFTVRKPVRKFTSKSKATKESSSNSDKPLRKFTSKSKATKESSTNSDIPLRKFATKGKSKRVSFENQPPNEDNQLSPPLRKFTSKKPKQAKKQSKVGNSFMYTHPNGRKEKVKVTAIGPTGQLEVHIPSLADEVQGKPKFKKNQKVFIIFKNGMAKESGMITHVYADTREYSVRVGQGIMPRVKERNLRDFSDFKRVNSTIGSYYLPKNA